MTAAAILATGDASSLLECYFIVVTGSAWVVSSAGSQVVLPDGQSVFVSVPSEAVQIASFAY
jgi:hypothetical protein